MVEVKYLKDHGTSKKDDVKKMSKSTAQALAKHKVLEIVKEEPAPAPKAEGKPGPITSKNASNK